MKGTGAGEGGILKFPVATNCTWPLGKFCASAAVGVTAMELRTRLGAGEEPQAVAKLMSIASRVSAEIRLTSRLVMAANSILDRGYRMPTIACAC